MQHSPESRPARKAGSLHQRILGDIEDNILSGQWTPGHRIPFEHELATQYGCSRMTVNKALTQLARAGLIVRRRKAGSIVVRPHTQSAVLKIEEIGAEVAALGLAYRFEIVSRTTRPGEEADRSTLGIATETTLIEIECLHFADDQPFCLERRLINLSAVPDAGSERFDETPPGTWLVRQVPWTTAEHVIRATGADHAVADRLDIAEGTPCLVVERRTWDATYAITHVTLTYPGDGHALVARFTPSQG